MKMTQKGPSLLEQKEGYRMSKDKTEFNSIIQNLIENEKVQEMKLYNQHGNTSCFEHCYDVAYTSYKVAKFLHFDYKAMTRAAMLHDMFLYDWHEKTNPRRWHAFNHGQKACNIASKEFELSDKEKDMIIKHMWPVTFAFPKSKEGFLLTFIDKHCALKEKLKEWEKSLTEKKAVKLAYAVFGFLFFKKL